MHHRIIFLTAILIAFIANPARADEGRACTQMWCQEGFALNLDGGTWPAGSYRFVITADGQRITCEGRLPFASCDSTTRCDSDAVLIGESGCALPANAQSFHMIQMPKPPAHIAVDITHSSGKHFHYENAVQPQCGYPNGKGCDPHPCCSATMSTSVVWN
ncbi:MAG: hypothetical protein IT567_02900 [Alphaproteobacteria bacterium]|nr:hypothetical protein [Alphaproteobacteria bacterium]